MSSKIFINSNQQPLASLPSRNPEVKAFHQSLPHYNITPLIAIPGIAKELGIAYLFVKDESSRFGLSAFKILGVSRCFTLSKMYTRQVQSIDINSVNIT